MDEKTATTFLGLEVSNVDCHQILGAPRGASPDELKEQRMSGFWSRSGMNVFF